jgi:hypothetical protein
MLLHVQPATAFSRFPSFEPNHSRSCKSAWDTERKPNLRILHGVGD